MVRPVHDKRGIYSDTALKHPSQSVIKVTLFFSLKIAQSITHMHHVRVTLCGLRRIQEALSSFGEPARGHTLSTAGNLDESGP